MATNEFNKKIFWREDFREGNARGGIWRRAFDLREFLEKVEDNGGEVVGLQFDENNLQVIIVPKEQADNSSDTN